MEKKQIKKAEKKAEKKSEMWILANALRNAGNLKRKAEKRVVELRKKIKRQVQTLRDYKRIERKLTALLKK